MKSLFSYLFILLIIVSSAGAQIRIVAYNCANRPNNTTEQQHFRTIFQAIEHESVNGVAKRLDILIMSEMDEGSAADLVTLLNDLHNVSTYTSILSSSRGGDRTGVIYDSSTIQYVDTTNLPFIETHPNLRAQFQVAGSTEQFYVYAIHLKSGSWRLATAKRFTELIDLRVNADSLGQGIPIIYAGDFNITGSSEGAWKILLAAGNGQAEDPANAPGKWRDNPSFIHLHTQNPGNRMNDRFDFIFISGEFSDGSGIEYIPNSFRVFGNNGTHTLNGAISTGTGASSNVLTALEGASDHLPVIADFECK